MKNGGSWSHAELLRGAGVILGISFELLEAMLVFVQVFTGQIEKRAQKSLARVWSKFYLGVWKKKKN